MSVKNGHTEVAFGARGPFDVRNVWGENATYGKFLWLQIRRGVKDEDVISTTPGTIRRAASFQVVPYVSRERDMRVENDALSYTGYTGFEERCVNLLVGRVVDVGRRTVRDQAMIEQAQGLTAKKDLDLSYHQSQGLEMLKVAVAPQWGGRFVLHA